MKKSIIPILGVLGISIIFFFSFNQEKEEQLVENIRLQKVEDARLLKERKDKKEIDTQLEKEKRFKEEVKSKKKFEKLNLYCKLELYNLEGDFNNAEGALWDDDDELRRIRRRASTLTVKCKFTSYSSNFFKLQKKCNKQLN